MTSSSKMAPQDNLLYLEPFKYVSTHECVCVCAHTRVRTHVHACMYECTPYPHMHSVQNKTAKDASLLRYVVASMGG
jgi:hypothetical protein